MTPLDRHRRAGDEPSRPPAQPQTRPDDVPRFADPPERDPTDDVVLEFIQRGGHHL